MKKKIFIFFGAIIVTSLMISSVSAININQINNDKKIIESLIGPPPNIEWEKTYTSTHNDYGLSTDQTSDNGYIIAGVRSENTEYNEILVIKTDQNGNKQWEKTFGEGIPNNIQQTSDNGYIISSIKYIEAQEIQSKLIKISSNGNQVWSKTYLGDSEFDCIKEVWQTSDEGYILIGAKMNGLIDSDIWLIKTNSQGNIQWEKTYDNSELLTTYSDSGLSVWELNSGGYIIAGITTKIALIDSYTNVWLIKTDANGNKLKENTFGETFSMAMWSANSVRETQEGGFIVTGARNRQSSKYNTYFWALKTDSNLNKKKTFEIIPGIEKYEGFNIACPTYEGGFILIGQGSTIDPPDISSYTKLVKLNTNLYEEWHIDFGVNDDNMYNAIKPTTDHGFIIAGGNNGNTKLLKLEKENLPPNKPNKPSGSASGTPGTSYEYTSSTTDPENNQIYYKFSWGDGSYSEWLGPYNSGTTVKTSHNWDAKGTYKIQVKAKDTGEHESEWSDSLSVNMPRPKAATNTWIKNIFKTFMNKFGLLQ